MAFAWARRTRELHDELAAIADVTSLGPTWWLVAGTAAAAEPLPPRAHYVVSDAEPNGDTFIGHRSPSPVDPIADAIARAHAARAALRELDGQLPDQPLAVTIQRSDVGARVIPSSLEVAAFAIGDTVVIARLAAHVDGERELIAKLAEIARTSTTTFGDEARIRFDDSLARRDARDVAPFVCVSIGEERITVARHGHRRAWRDNAGPWLGLGRVGELATTSTCHMVVDGYGHAWLAARIAELHSQLLARSTSSNPAAKDIPSALEPSSNAVRTSGSSDDNTRDANESRVAAVLTSLEHSSNDGPMSSSGPSGDGAASDASDASEIADDARDTSEPGLAADDLPHLALVPDAIPLGVAWRELPSPAPRALELAYALGRVLHRVAGKPGAKFSPTFQIPIAPGDAGDPERSKRRVVATAVSVRFDHGEPEPFDVFAERARAILAREAQGRGLCSRLLTAARAVPVPLAFKRRSFTAGRAGVFDKIAEVVGGRACLSKIRMSTPIPLSCAVSSPARLATQTDPVGGCVLTIIDDGTRAAITACGSGLAGSADDAADLIDAVLALL